jgi:hypothetical protein
MVSQSMRGSTLHVPATSFQSWLLRCRAAARVATTRIASWPPPRVIAAFVAVEWVSVFALARTVRHNGWTYYQGGDQLWYYSLGWLLSHGHLYQTPIGYLWPWWLAPIARGAGPDAAAAYPTVILLNVLVLLPVAMVALYVLASRLAGRVFGYWTLLLWIVLPFVGVLITDTGYHQRYTELVLPQSLGLTAMADFPTLVATLVCLAFCARATLSSSAVTVFDPLASGVAAGAAVALKPSISLILLGPVLALILRRTLVGLVSFGAGAAPAILALAVWKERGLGHLPLLAQPSPIPADLAAAPPIVALNLHKYFGQLKWHTFITNLDLLREHFWSGRLLEWLVVAGLIAVARISWRGFALVAGSFVPFVLVKSSYASIEDASLFRILIPAFPLFVLCVAALPFLVPGARRPATTPTPRYRIPRRVRIGLLAAVVAATAVIPAFAFAAARRSGPPDLAVLQNTPMPIPVNIQLGLDARVRGEHVLLRWDDPTPRGSRVFYRVWRDHPTGNRGLTCSQEGAANCTILGTEVASTRVATASDRPGTGTWVYRVGVAANWLDDFAQGDVYFASEPVIVRVP